MKPTKAYKRESGVENYLTREAAKRSGLLIYKVEFPGNPGAPDRLLLIRHLTRTEETRTLWIELKSPDRDNKGDPHQVIIHRRLRRYNQDVRVANTKELVNELMQEIDEWQQK